MKEKTGAPGAIARTAAVRCDVAAPAITGAKLLRNGLENATKVTPLVDNSRLRHDIAMPASCHTVDYAPFTKSQLASRY